MRMKRYGVAADFVR